MRNFKIYEKIEKFIEEEMSGWEWHDYGVNGVGTDDTDLIMADIRESLPLTVYLEKGDYFEETEYRKAYRSSHSSIEGKQGNYGVTVVSELGIDDETFLLWYEKYGVPNSLETDE